MKTRFYAKTMVTLCLLLMVFQLNALAQTITNGDFESWTGGTPDGWTINIVSSSLEFTQAVDMGVTGDALQILSLSNPGGYDAEFYTVVTGINPGSYYDLSIMLKGNDDMMKLRYFGMQWLDADNVQIGSNIDENTFNANTGNAWTAFDLFTNPIMAPAGAAKLRVTFRAYNGVGYTANTTTLWIDDLSVTEHVFIDPARTATSVTQDPLVVGGLLNFAFDPETYICNITQDAGEMVPWVVANGTYAPYSGNWIGVAIDFPDAFTGAFDLVSYTINGVAQTPPHLSVDEIAAEEIWFYFEMDGEANATYTLVINWDGNQSYQTETFVIHANDLSLQQNPAIQDGIDNTNLSLTPATQTIMTTEAAVITMDVEIPELDSDFPADLYGDVLFVFSNPLPAGAQIDIVESGFTVAEYTATGGETNLWLFEDLSTVVDRMPMTDIDNDTHSFEITFSNMSEQTTYNITADFIADVITGFTNPGEWYVFANDNAQIIVSDVPIFTIPLFEGFENDFTYFDNAAGNLVSYNIVTNFVFEGSKAVHNAYGNSNNNVLVQLGPVDLTTTTNPTLKFAHIAETEGNFDHCYVEISTDGGATWVILPTEAYMGNGLYVLPLYNLPEGPCFTEDSYVEWDTPSAVDNNWWRQEKFSLAAYATSGSVLIRFRLKSDSSVIRAGWFIDAITLYDELCPEPTQFAASTLWSDGATFSWNSSGDEWNIEVGTSGFVPGTGAELFAYTGVTENPYLASGMQAETTYQAYIQSNCGGDGLSLWSGPVTFTTLPACPAPINLTISNLGSSSVDLAWTQPGTPDTWDILYGLHGFNIAVEGTLINNTSDNPYLLTGLTPATAYQYYVRSDCGSQTSAWVGPFSFTTSCLPITSFPYTESFNGTTFAPTCWTNVKTAGTGTPGIWDRQTAGTSPTCTPHSGAAMARYNCYSLSTGTSGILVTPAFEFPNDNYQVVFWMYRDNGYLNNLDRVNVYYNTTNNLTGATLLGTVHRSWTQSPAVATANQWYEYTFYMPEGVSGNGFFILEAVSALGNNIFVDDVTVMEKPACPVPSLLSATNVQATEATLNWTGGASVDSYDIAYGPTGFNPNTEGTLIEGVEDSPYLLEGLTPATTYSFYVRSVCGGTPTDWSTVTNFSTLCTIIDEFPWTEEFTSWTPITTCWNLTGGTQTPLHYNNSAMRANYWSWSSGTTAYARSPLFDVSALGNPHIEFFWSHQYNTSYPNDRLVLQVSDNGGTTWANVWDKSGSALNSNDGAAYTTPGSYVSSNYIDISSFGTNVMFRFYFYSGYGPDVFIDKVSIIDLPSCMWPTDLTAGNATNTSIDLSWNENYSATQWDIVYGLPGFDPESDGTLVEGISDTYYTINSLADGETYEAYVRSNCGGGDVSSWTGPVEFMTIPYCLQPVTLVASNITIEGADIAWTDPGSASSFDIIYGINGFNPNSEGTLVEDVTSPYTISGLMAATTYQAYVRANCAGDLSPWSNPVSFSTLLCNTGDQCQYTFNLNDSYGDGWNGNSVDVFQAGIFVQNITLASGSSATVNVNLCPDLNTHLVYHTGSYISEVSFTVLTPWGETIYSGSGFTTGSNNQTIFTWISACTPPTCPQPVAFINTSVGSYTAGFSWTEDGDATTWQIIYGAQGFDPVTEGTLITDITGSSEYIVTGLEALTEYEFYVRADCGADDLSYWTGPVGVTTLPTCPQPIEFASTAVTAFTSSFSWTEVGEASTWQIIYGAPDFDPETEGTLIADITGSSLYEVTGLTPETDYEFYVRADCGGDDYSEWTGPVAITTQPTCPQPSDVLASNITENSAEIMWAENGDATLWDFAYSDADFNPDTEGTLIEGLSTSVYLLDGILSAATTYYVYVRSDCGDDDYSEWAGPYTFNTVLCNPANQCQFTFNLTDSYGDGWNGNNIDILQSGVFVTNLTLPSGYNITHQVNLCPGLPTEIVYHTGSFIYEVSFNIVTPWGETIYSGSGFTTDSNNQIVFSWVAACEPPTCPGVSNITANPVTNHTATINWVENGDAELWDLAYGLPGFDPDTEGTLIEGITTSQYQILGLDALTQYEAYVRSDCGDGDLSFWFGPVTFTTLVACPPIAGLTLIDATYETLTLQIQSSGDETEWNVVYGLNGFVVGEGTSIVVTENPFTISGLEELTYYDFYIQANCGVDGVSTFSSVYSFWTTEMCPDVWNITVSDITTEGMTLAWNHTSYQDTWNIEVGIPGFIPGTGAAILTFNGVTDNPYVIANGLNPETYYTAYVMADCDALGTSGWVGSTTFQTWPTCMIPIDVTVSDIGPESAVVSWTETGSAGIWNIIYGPAGFDPLSSGTLVEGLTQPTYTITGLSPTTQYSVYVQADCGDGDISNWSVVSNFTSACGIINEFTWVEEFNVWSLITQCWGLTGGTQTVSQYLGNAVRANFWSWTSGNNAYLKSPLIDKSSLENPRLEFFWSHLYSSSYPNDRLVVEISDDNGVSWTNVWELSGPLFNSNDGAGNTMPGTYTTSGQINLSSFDDIIQFRFNFISGYGPDVFIDKVTIFDIVCNAPVDLAVSDVTTSSATITWVDESGTADVDLIYGTTGFDPLSQGTIITNVSSPYLLTGLDEGSSYDVYVRSNCDGDITSDWTGPVNFTTEITPLNDETDILTYSFGSLDAETAVIDPVAKTVYVLVIAGTDLSNLVANFSLSNGASAKVGSVDQVSGETSNNFSLGSVVYTVTAEDGVTTTDWTVTVEVWIGIRNSDNFGLSVLPNPNNGQFILQLNHNSDNCVCELTDVTGRTILSKKLSGNGSISEYFDVNLAPGSYYLKVISGDKVITEKLIIE